MTLSKLVKNLIREKFEFSFEYGEDGEIYLCIILGNREYMIQEGDKRGIEELWNDIQTYWLHN